MRPKGPHPSEPGLAGRVAGKLPLGRKVHGPVAVAVTLALALYPLLVYVGLTYFGSVWVAGSLLVLCAARLLAAYAGSRSVSIGRPVAIACGGGIFLGLVSAVQRSPQAVMFYPALVNAALLVVFAYSLAYPPTVIERIARLSDGDLSPAGIAYTRNVTMSWCVFFSLNGGVALYTALFSSLQTWTLYNGVVAYGLIAVMLVGERVLRRRVIAGADA